MLVYWGSRRLGIISGSSPIATQVPHAAGIAYAARYRGADPVVWICENNHYAISVPQSKQMAIENVADRAEGYGFPGVVVDGNDPLACYAAMKEAHDRAREGGGPTLIECKTYRYFPHTSDDDDKSYRTREEVEEARTHDPIVGFERYLGEHG